MSRALENTPVGSSKSDLKTIAAGTTDTIDFTLQDHFTVLHVHAYALSTGLPLYGMLSVGGQVVKHGWFGTFSSVHVIRFQASGSHYVPGDAASKIVRFTCFNPDPSNDRQVNVAIIYARGFAGNAGLKGQDLPQVSVYQFVGTLTQSATEDTPISITITPPLGTLLEIYAYTISTTANRVFQLLHQSVSGTKNLAVIDSVTINNSYGTGPVIKTEDGATSGTPLVVGIPNSPYAISYGDKLIFNGVSMANTEAFTVHLRGFLHGAALPDIDTVGTGVALSNDVSRVISLRSDL